MTPAIAIISQTNGRVQDKRRRKEAAVDLAKAQTEAAWMDARLAEIKAEKTATLMATAFPVPGLGFDDDGVTLNGLPLDQASGAEQLRVSLAMGLALNPTLRVILIRDGSLLDSRSIAMVQEMATEAKAQVWLESVGTGGVGVTMEDGMVVEVKDIT